MSFIFTKRSLSRVELVQLLRSGRGRVQVDGFQSIGLVIIVSVIQRADDVLFIVKQSYFLSVSPQKYHKFSLSSNKVGYVVSRYVLILNFVAKPQI